jgi:hypothetical protein
MVRNELSRQAASQEMETFDEADDFDVPDEEEWTSPYELSEMQEEVLLEPPEEASTPNLMGTVNSDEKPEATEDDMQSAPDEKENA